MRTLDEIRKEYNNAVENQQLILLMNELERDYGAFCYKPSEKFMEKPEVVLYREISASRIF